MVRGGIHPHKNRLRGTSYSWRQWCSQLYQHGNAKRRDHSQGRHLTIQNNCIWAHLSKEAKNQFLTWPLVSYLALANLKSSLHALESLSKDDSNANISRADAGQEERMRSNHAHHCGSRHMGICRL